MDDTTNHGDPACPTVSCLAGVADRRADGVLGEIITNSERPHPLFASLPVTSYNACIPVPAGTDSS